MGDNRRRFPLWGTNVLVFGCLFAAVVTYFLWQIHETRKDFLIHVREQALLVGEMAEISAKGAVLSRRVSEEILQTFLGNAARFVDYLDSVEPFVSDELAAFSGEAGLAGIRILHKGRAVVEGPKGWLPDLDEACGSEARLTHRREEGLYLFSSPRKSIDGGCIIVGTPDAGIEALQQHLGFETVMARLSQLPGMRYVRVERREEGDAQQGLSSSVEVVKTPQGEVAEARLPFENNVLAVGLEARHLTAGLRRLWRDFFAFSGGLALLGVVLSLILYRQQTAHLAQVKSYEESISKEREAAALGRAAAAIAHEIRNPLNAIGMGLQRLQLEDPKLGEEHRRLVEMMEAAVKRANAAVRGLLNYARPHLPAVRRVRVDRILEGILDIYQAQCKASGIQVRKRIAFQGTLMGDPDLLTEVLENLIRNAVQAQPQGGFIELSLHREDGFVVFRCRNSGFPLPAHEAHRILEPYFSTKADGTGLGVPIARRIIEAHQGQLEVLTPVEGVLEIVVSLPADLDVNDLNREREWL